MLAWENSPVHCTADEALAAQSGDSEERGEKAEAREFLRTALADGPLPAREVKSQARDAGISETTLNRAKRDLGIKPEKSGFGGGWYWRIPDQDGQDTNAEALATFAGNGHLRQGGTEKAIACTPLGEPQSKMASSEGVDIFDAIVHHANGSSPGQRGDTHAIADREGFEERAAILEYDVGLPREEAERLALIAARAPMR